jgi:FkbM family methyltransferase
LQELTVTESCFRLSKAGSLVVDVGANIGHMTSAFTHAVQSDGTVYAFEPHPELFEYLERNAASFRDEIRDVDVRLYNEAVGRSEEEATLYVPDHWAENAGLATLQPRHNAREVTIQVVRLDDRVSDTIQVLKLDVEGHEIAVLHGAEQLLTRRRIRHIVFEDHAISESGVVDLLRSYGYTIFTVEQRLMGPRLSQTLSSSDYNFIASVDVAECESRFRPSGWRCLER